ncbi:MAG: radical SAM protein [Bacilli bacterium]|jgi:DNA repair photolyase
MPAVIYEPRGRAREYSPLAVNLYRGCDHGCEYCFGPAVLRMRPEEFLQPAPRDGVIAKIAVDAKALQTAGNDKPILLCFTCDPYMQLETECRITREALEILFRHEQPIQILTKGGRRSVRDFDLLAEHPGRCTYAATLTFTDPADLARYEPGADTYAGRVAALQEAHRRGIETWVSCEPVIDPAQTLAIIRETHEYVDQFRVGKLNARSGEMASLERGVDWYRFAREVVDLLQDLGANYYIKEDLKPYLRQRQLGEV